MGDSIIHYTYASIGQVWFAKGQGEIAMTIRDVRRRPARGKSADKLASPPSPPPAKGPGPGATAGIGGSRGYIANPAPNSPSSRLPRSNRSLRSSPSINLKPSVLGEGTSSGVVPLPVGTDYVYGIRRRRGRGRGVLEGWRGRTCIMNRGSYETS